MLFRILGVVTVLASAAVASASSQRLGLAPTGDKYYLIPANSTKSVACYCLDLPLKPPKDRRLYLLAESGQPPTAQVWIGDKWLPLANAIADGKVELEASGEHTAVTVRNRTEHQIALWVGSATVLGDNPKRRVAGIDLAALRPGSSPLSHDPDVQNEIWERQFDLAFRAVRRHWTIDDYVAAGEDPGYLVSFVRRATGPRALLLDPRHGVALYDLSDVDELGRPVPAALGSEAIKQFNQDDFNNCPLGEKSDAKTVFIRVGPFGIDGRRGLTLWYGDANHQEKSVWVSEKNLTALLTGGKLEENLDTDLRVAFLERRVIVVRDAFTRAAALGTLTPESAELAKLGWLVVGEDKEQDRAAVWQLDAVQVLQALQRAYPETEFLLDDPEQMDRAKQRAETIPVVVGRKDITVLYDPDLKDQGTISIA
jgi:hypothetical protein